MGIVGFSLLLTPLLSLACTWHVTPPSPLVRVLPGEPSGPSQPGSAPRVQPALHLLGTRVWEANPLPVNGTGLAVPPHVHKLFFIFTPCGAPFYLFTFDLYF